MVAADAVDSRLQQVMLGSGNELQPERDFVLNINFSLGAQRNVEMVEVSPNRSSTGKRREAA